MYQAIFQSDFKTKQINENSSRLILKQNKAIEILQK